MANTYSQLYFHLVFAVKNRRVVISREWSKELNAFIIGIIRNEGCVCVRIGGVADHRHVLIKANPDTVISALVQKIKIGSTKWINTSRLTNEHFNWQEGYGIFSVSATHVQALKNYIDNQETHHHGKALEAEFRELLEKNGVEYDERYVLRNPADL